jgi:hypothetical protein
MLANKVDCIHYLKFKSTLQCGIGQKLANSLGLLNKAIGRRASCKPQIGFVSVVN